MNTKTKKGNSERDKFIVEKAKDFSVTAIRVLLKQEGFVPVSRARIYQILERAGITPK